MIFAHVRKSPLAQARAIFSCTPSMKNLPPGRFIHDHRLWENRPFIIWPWEVRPYDSDLLNGGNFFMW